MQVIRSSQKAALELVSPVVATLGNFDGLHRGHQSLLSRVVAASRGIVPGRSGTTVVISFYPHPAVVLKKTAQVPQLTDLRQKVALLSEQAIDFLYLIHFTPSLASLSAEEFIQRELLDRLNIQHLVLGPDARVGKGREGTPQFIQAAMKSAGRSVEILPALLEGERRISSGIIREAIAQGDLPHAGLLLGRWYAVNGRVIRGAGRGSAIGVPTANLSVGGRMLPQRGVYACFAELEGQRYQSVVNIGVRPTVESGQADVSVEAHLLSFPHRPLYGKRIEIEFRARIRDEQRFETLDALSEQIQRDIVHARTILDQRDS